MSDTSTLSAESTLTVLDRCDRCGAQAWVRARYGEFDLLFCRHHANKHADILGENIVEDARHILEQQEAN